jgi:DNA-directed RNA polymerase I, II, and III subunit RPABC2
MESIMEFKKTMEEMKKIEEMKNIEEEEDINEEEDVEDDYDEDEEDDDDDDEFYLQKFKSEMNQNYLIDIHPECMKHRDEEISILSKVVRDDNNIIIDDLHRTIPYLTKYEKARVIGVRAKQINMGAQIFIDVDSSIIDSVIIAEKELLARKMPFIIRRPLPGGGSEYWNLTDLEIL